MGSSILNKVIDIFGLGDEYEVYEDWEESSSADAQKNTGYKDTYDRNGGKVLRIQEFRKDKVMVIKPLEYEDMIKVCNCLKEGHIVIMDLNKLEMRTAQKCMDFASGAVMAIDGTMSEISKGIFIMASRGSEIVSDISSSIPGNEVFSWVKETTKF